MSQDSKDRLHSKLRTLEQQHLMNMERIGQIRLLSYVNGPVMEALTRETREEYSAAEVKNYNATHNGVRAFERLLNYAETRNSGQIQRIAQFLAGVWGVDQGLKLECLVSLDQAIGEDMLAVLNAIRTNALSIRDMSVDGSKRVPAALRLWGYQ